MASKAALGLLRERQCQKIYSALDSGKPEIAIKEADKILKASKDLHLAVALKAIALHRASHSKQASRLCDDLLKLPSLSSSTLYALCMALSSLRRVDDEAKALETASKASPSDLELGRRTFLALARAGQWQRAQQTALRLHKAPSQPTHQSNAFFWWTICAYLALSRNKEAVGAQLALPLADRMIAKHLEKAPLTHRSDEEMFVCVDVKGKMAARESEKDATAAAKLHSEAIDLLTQGVGAQMVERNLALELQRLELRRKASRWSEISVDSGDRIRRGNRNWAHFAAYVEAAVALDHGAAEPEHCRDADKTLRRMAEGEDAGDRGIRLARLELFSRARKASIPPWVSSEDGHEKQQQTLLSLCTAYFDDFSTKACATEDLIPHLEALGTERLSNFRSHLAAHDPTSSDGPATFADDDALHRALNAAKLGRLFQSETGLDADHERQFARRAAKVYSEALSVGKALPKTEMQPADDFALISSHALVRAWTLSGDAASSTRGASAAPFSDDLAQAAALLEQALEHSPKGYRLRFLLIRLLSLLGDFEGVEEHWDRLGTRSVQKDTLSWIIVEEWKTRWMASEKATRKTMNLRLKDLEAVYEENDTDVLNLIAKLFKEGTYSKVEEFIDFYQCLDHSIARANLDLELIRTKALPSDTVGENVDATSRLAALRARRLRWGPTSDQRDRSVLPTFLPLGSDKVLNLTSWYPAAKVDSVAEDAALEAMSAFAGLGYGGGFEAARSIEEDTLSKAQEYLRTRPEVALLQILHQVRRSGASGLGDLGGDLLQDIATKSRQALGGHRGFTTLLTSASFAIELTEVLHRLSSAPGPRGTVALLDIASVLDAQGKAPTIEGGSVPLYLPSGFQTTLDEVRKRCCEGRMRATRVLAERLRSAAKEGLDLGGKS